MEEHKFFQKEFICYSTAYLALQDEKKYNKMCNDMENSDKIIVPSDVLQHLTLFEVANPIILKISSKRFSKSIYCGILEFTAPKHVIYMPQWMMDNLNIEEGEKVDDL